MALRTSNIKQQVSREIFTKIDPEILDGTCKNVLKPARQAPATPPTPPPLPSPPSPALEETTEEPINTTNNLDEKIVESNNIVIEDKPTEMAQHNEDSNKSETVYEDTPTPNQSFCNVSIRIKSETKSKPKFEPSSNETPPAAPPRKRSNNKQPNHQPTYSSLPTQESNTNKTIVRIVNDESHKLKIKNEFSIGPIISNEKKTSILISGDDCYSTVNVNDDVPLYQSSVVVNEGNVNQIEIKYNKSSTVYITNELNNEDNNPKQCSFNNIKIAATSDNNNIYNDEYYTINCFERETNTKSIINNEDNRNKKRASSDYLKRLLNDPVEAVRMNLVPHVCGKSDVSKKETGSIYDSIFNENKDDFLAKLQLLTLNDNKDDLSEHSSYSTQYEIMDPGSDCYTDNNSNRSSITEEELAARTKFYDLLSDTIPIEVSDGDDHHYESINNKLVDPIYEEIEIPPPLPSNPPPQTLLDDLQIDKELTTRYVAFEIHMFYLSLV